MTFGRHTFQNDEFVVAASGLVIQTVFVFPLKKSEVLRAFFNYQKNGRTSMKEILPARDLKRVLLKEFNFRDELTQRFTMKEKP